MATIITKYSDYMIQSIEFFITAIENYMVLRDIAGLSNGKIELLTVTKEHPLAKLMAAQLADNRNASPLQGDIIPAISVTPGSMADKGFTLGQSFKPEVVDDDFIAILNTFYNQTNREVQTEVLITKDQIDEIKSEYKRTSSGGVRVEAHEWFKSEEIIISVWSDTPNIDILLGNLMDACLADTQVGFAGDNSKLRNFEYRITKGLTNFNFGRVLYGSEYNLTFVNSYNNFTIYKDDVISGHDTNFTEIIPGES